MQGGTCHRHPRQNDLAFFELWIGATKAGAMPGPVNFRLAPPDARLFMVPGMNHCAGGPSEPRAAIERQVVLKNMPKETKAPAKSG
jgi:hypothetical protein